MDNSGNPQKSIQLSIDATRAIQEGKFEKALDLLNQAINIAEQSGMPTFQLRMRREKILNGFSDYSKLVPIMEEALAFYKQQQNTGAQIDTLLELASTHKILMNVVETSAYLSELESLINSLNYSQSATISQMRISFCRKEINRLRKQIGL